MNDDRGTGSQPWTPPGGQPEPSDPNGYGRSDRPGDSAPASPAPAGPAPAGPSFVKNDSDSAPQYSAGPAGDVYGPPTSEAPVYDGAPAYGTPQPGPQAGPYGSDPTGSYAPPPGGYPPPGGFGGPGGPGGPPPRKKRTGLLVGLLAGGLVVVLGLVIGVVLIVRAAGGSGDPTTTVQAYLEALSKGDAATALEQGPKPSDTAFLTNEVLTKQRDIAAIRDVTVSKGYQTSTRASVTATYRFGERQANERFSLTKIDGDWKLDDVAYGIDLQLLDNVPGLQLFGVSTEGKSEAYVFPGPLQWGSESGMYTITDSDADEFPLSPYDGRFSFSRLETDLSDQGKQAIATAVGDYLSECAKATTLEPDDCPQREYDFEAVDGSAKWTAPDDLSDLEYYVDTSEQGSVRVSGQLTWSVSYTAEDYDGKRSTKTADDITTYLSGTVDLSESEPTYTEN